MSQERKRVERILPPKVIPKKIEEPIKVEEVKVEVKPVKARVDPKPKQKEIPKKEEKVKAAEVIKTPVKQKLVVKAVELISEDLVVPEAKRTRTKASDDKYIRFSEKNYSESSKIVSDRLQKGEIKYAYYAIDGDEGYHYFLINKTI